MAKQKSVVAIVKGTDPTKMVEEALDLLGGVSSLITPKSKVFLKTNTGHPQRPEVGDTNSPAMVTACIKAFQKGKPADLCVAESAALGQNTQQCFEVTGHLKAAQEAGSKCVNLKDQMAWTRRTVKDYKVIPWYLVPTMICDPNAYLVSVPIFKLHGSCTVTSALKNMKGLIKDDEHRRMHFLDLNGAIADLCVAYTPHLSIIELLRFGEGIGSSAKWVDMGLVIASKDPVAADATACRCVGVDVEQVTHVRYCAERGLGNIAENQIEIRGKSIKEVFRQCDIPYLKGLPAYAGYQIYAEKACSSCLGSIMGLMGGLQRNPENYEKNKGLTIIAGPHKSLPKGVGTKKGKDKNLILIGNCTAKYRDKGVFVAGCPPRGTPPRLAVQTREDQGDLEYGWDVVEREDTGGASILPEAKAKTR